MMSVPRTLKQPGTPSRIRIDTLAGDGMQLSFTLAAGKTLRDALIEPLMAAGMQGGTVRIHDLTLTALHFVRPTLPKDDQHVAFYSEPHHIAHPVTLKVACATIGRKDGAPFVHCHAIWEGDDGLERGGHLFTDQVFVQSPARAEAWGLPDVVMQADFDEETNFTLFHPIRTNTAGTGTTAGQAGRCVIAKICPNEDLVLGIEAACREHGISNAIVRGSVGSIVGAEFEDGKQVQDIATEILVAHGVVSGASPEQARCTLDIALIDPSGAIHRGRIKRASNPILICFELVLEEVSANAALESLAGAQLQ